MAEGRKRRVLIAFGIYLVVSAVYFALAPRSRLVEHTPFNHFALLADSWVHGRMDLLHGPPPYAQNNDFASFHGKWFVAFPPFPAVLLVPFVAWGKTPENVRDGQFFLWLAGIGPAVLFLVLEKLRRMGETERSERTNAALSLLLAFGTVYFFTALQGTVWFAAHIVGVAIGALFLLFALGAERPVLAGTMIGLGFLTRPPLLYAAPFFVFEAVQATLAAAPAAPEESARLARFKTFVGRLDERRLTRLVALFTFPVVVLVGLSLAYNRARFGNLWDFGYQYLTVAWQARMKRWGLFSYHYLGRNLGIVLTSLPWHEPGNHLVPFQINDHGLALWLTTPLYVWLLWPQKKSPRIVALYLAAAAVALPGLFYQNTGWMQFGYRFSNDYAVFLFVLLALAGQRFGKLFGLAAAIAVLVNTFGAVTFDRDAFRRFYYEDPSQKIIYQPD